MSAHVYRCYDADGHLLYIGCTVSLKTRLREHDMGSLWWPDVARTESVAYPTRDEAATAEADAIATEHPRWNFLGRSREHPDGWASNSHRAPWLQEDRRRLLAIAHERDLAARAA